jgi:hypothetical protein
VQRTSDKPSSVKSLYIAYQLVQFFKTIKEANMNIGILHSQSIYFDLLTCRVTVGSFAFSEDTQTG